MNQFLTKEKIKWLKDYLNKMIPAKTIKGLKDIKARTGLELYYDTKTCRKQLWDYICHEIDEKNDPISMQIKEFVTTGNFDKAGGLVNSYIDLHYANEWATVHQFEFDKIDNDLNGVCGFARENYINRIDIYAIIEGHNIDDFLNQYERKNINPEALKKTESMKKMIDEYFGDIRPHCPAYNVIIDAINAYLETKDEQILNNLLNR